MGFSIVAPYAAVLTLIYLFLAGSVGRARSHSGPSLGSGSGDVLIADRRHMNFVESVPFALLLLSFVEASGAARGWIHALCIVLVVARVVHPFGIDPNRGNHPARAVGAGGTFLVMLASALTLLWKAFV